MTKTSTQTKPRMTIKTHKLKVFKPFRCLVVSDLDERSEGESWINKGSRINCGICGGTVGQINSDIKFPFSVHAFKSRLANSRLHIRNQIRCQRKECRNVIFPDSNKVSFVSFDQFKKLQLDAQKENSKVYGDALKVLAENQRKMERQSIWLFILMRYRKITRWIKNLFSKKQIQ